MLLPLRAREGESVLLWIGVGAIGVARFVGDLALRGRRSSRGPLTFWVLAALPVPWMRVESAIDRVPSGLVSRGVLGDARLVGLASRGDEAAFAAIFGRYHQPLYRYCRAITGDGEDASDALQNTMVRAMRAFPGERRTVELKPWLFRVAHNESVSLLRRRRPDSPLEGKDTRAVDGPEVGLAAREELRELMSDLHELPERQRAAVILRELNGLSYAEIGSVFDTSTAAAKQAAYDGRVALQDYAKGRAMDCEAVTRAISDGEVQFLRGRKLRGHLRSCAECADFKQALEARSARMSAIAPALPATAAAALMEKLFAGGSAGGGSVGLAAAGGKLMAGAAAMKGATAVVAAVTVAAGAVIGGVQLAPNDRVAQPATERSDPAAVHSADAVQSEAGRGALDRRLGRGGQAGGGPAGRSRSSGRDDAAGSSERRRGGAGDPLGTRGDPAGRPGAPRSAPPAGAGPAPQRPSAERRGEPAGRPVTGGHPPAFRPKRPSAPVTPPTGAPSKPPTGAPVTPPTDGAPTTPASPTSPDPAPPPTEPRPETAVPPSAPGDRPSRPD